MSESRLAFGYNRGLPEEVRAAWGCRAIITQDGSVDVVWDRTSSYGPAEVFHLLADHLNAGAGERWRARASELLADGTINTRVDREHELLADGAVIVKGNTSGSAGYLYVCAYPAPGGVLDG